MGNAEQKMGCTQVKPILTEYDKSYIAEMTSATAEQVTERYNEFLKMHPTGQITQDEFKSMIKTCYPEADTVALERHIFRMYDMNMDGSIDFKEFMILLYVMSAGTPEQNLEQIFRVFDINGDGTISRKEMRKIVIDLFQMFGSRDYADLKEASDDAIASMAFEEMDADSDGNVTREEFVTACMNHETISTMLARKITNIFIPDEG